MLPDASYGICSLEAIVELNTTFANTLSQMALARHLQIAAQSSDEEELYAPLGTSSGGPESAYGAAEGESAEAQVLPCPL